MRSTVWRSVPWLAGIAAATAWTMMAEISRLLARLEQAGAGSYSAHALTGWPGLPPWSGRRATEAIAHWSDVTAEIGLRTEALAWLRWHLVLDAVVLVPAYTVLLWFAVVAAGLNRRRWTFVVLLAFAVDQAETWTTMLLVGDLREVPGPVLAGVVAVLSALKWVTVVVVAGAILVQWLDPRVDKSGERVWRRHRVQIAVVVILLVVLVAPVGGPLDQAPDVVRTWTDGEGFPMRKVVGPAAGVLLLCVALWVAGRWALLDRRLTAEPLKSLSPFVHIGAAVVVAATVVAARKVLKDMTGAGLAVAGVLFVVGAVSLLLKERTGWRVEKPADKELVKYAGRCLAVAPIFALGMLMVRAFSGPVLLDVPVLSGITNESRAWLIAGVLIVAAAPATAWALAWADGRVAGGAPHVVGVVVLAVAVAAGIWAGVAPDGAGRYLRVVGLFGAALAGVTIILGWLQRRVELRPPARIFNKLPRTPVFALMFVTLLLAATLDDGRYHDVVVESGERPAQRMTLEQTFASWLTQAAACSVPVPGGRPAVPLVLVAAPGGGSRAAYWTADALDRLTAEVCGYRSLFAVSGVSGGSVGAALWASTRLGLPGRPDIATTGRGATRDIANEEPLAALLAGALYRDIPRMVHGINIEKDRAEVLERAWEHAHSPLRVDMMDAAPSPGTAGWRPVLLFNGTDVNTGCRVVVAPLPVSVTHRRDGRLTGCGSAVRETGGAGFAPGVIDARDYLGRTDAGNVCENALNATFPLSTAALLSARFPYLTPTGSLVHCNGTDPGQATRAYDVDGGYLENNGIALAMDMWQAMAPMVARHNAGAAASDAVLVVPMLVVLDNHYQSVSAATPPSRPSELVAPVMAYGAPRKAQTDPVHLQDAFLSFAGALPGLPTGRLRVGTSSCPDTRVFRVAPNRHPGVEAPLGWALSEWAQHDLRKELDAQVRLGGACGLIPERSPTLHPGSIATVLQLISGRLNVVQR
ncbi:hypothetical protein AB0M02_25795 [Actinoplanes sp. NPDC051861]|uniref:hypothetical protein n=1 Tax=Actinoplanes sp. NPDC051861 TaxID=3155170 RepID=UPI00342FD8DA